MWNGRLRSRRGSVAASHVSGHQGYHPQLCHQRRHVRKHCRLNAFFFHKSIVEQPSLGCHAGWKYPLVQLKSGAEPVGFPDLLIISIYSRSAFCGHTCLHVMMPRLAMEIGVSGLPLHKYGFFWKCKNISLDWPNVYMKSVFSLKLHSLKLHIFINTSQCGYIWKFHLAWP